MIARLAAGLAGVAAGCVAYGVGIERTAYQVRRFTLPVLPAGTPSVRLLHLSDVHLLPRQTRKRDFLAGLAGLEPDLVISTGDHISSPDAVPALLDSLGRLRDVPGAFVFGSNDLEAPRFKVPTRYLFGTSSGDDSSGRALPTGELRAGLEGLGWHDLEEKRARIELDGLTVHLRGTGDAHHDLDDYAAVAGPASSDGIEIGVTHAPYRRLLDAMTADGVPVILAGHTHGGQVAVPGRGALVTNCDLPAENAKGLFTHTASDHTSFVHVSAGIGMSPFAPYRFACPPEASLLTLVARPAAPASGL